jgi:hypothetical protein
MVRHLDIGCALIDIDYAREQQLDKGHQLSAEDAALLLRAGESLAAAIRRVQALETSRIGASNFLQANELDNYAFYQGVSFALARVHQVIKEQPDADA